MPNSSSSLARLQPTYPEVRALLWPLDPQAVFRTPVAVHDNYMGMALGTGGDGGAETTDAPGFDSLQWQGKRFLKEIYGPLEWVEFANGHKVERGAGAASAQSKGKKLAGWTLKPALTRLHSTISDGPKLPGAPDYDLRPALPEGEPVIEWEAQQGDKWERVTPARTPQWSALHHREAPANRSVKVKTKEQWSEGCGASFVIDGNGVAYGHNGDPALRIEWGNSWSLVFRGNSATARPQLERKSANDDGALHWRVVQRFTGAAALDEKWWKSRHTVTFYRLAELLVVAIDDTEFYYGADDKEGNLRPVNWRASPLRVSVWGASNIIQLASVRFDREAGFKREVEVAAPPMEAVEWECICNEVAGVSLPGSALPGGVVIPQTGIPFVDATLADLLDQGKSQLMGLNLERTKLSALWHEASAGSGRVDYELSLQGTPATAPFVTAFAAQFPPTANTPLPAPVNIRAALGSIEVESGNPESFPSAMARLSVSTVMLERFVPDWKNVVAPFRPLQIECDPKGDGVFERVFYGYLTPEGESSDGYNAGVLNLTAYDPKYRLRAPAALVDGRFAPLDLDFDGDALYGGQCVQKLLGYELGRDWASALNGDGNWRRYFPSAHYPLRSRNDDNSYWTSGATTITTNGFFLPPPFGDDVEKWIGTISKYDGAVFFYDPALGEKGAFVYGHTDRICGERGAVVYDLHENTIGLEAQEDKRLSAWPLLASYSAQGLLEKSFTRVQIWGFSPQNNVLSPSLFVGAATTPLPATDPLSEIASWPRTLLNRQEFIGVRVQNDYAQSLAQLIWNEFDGRAPRRFDFTLNDQILPAKWGEKVNWRGEELRVLSYKLSWTFGENSSRVTTITARSLSGTGL